MMPIVILIRCGLVALLVCVAMHGAALGCGVCALIGDPFRTPHPHAVRIAAATREALDRGTLHKADSEGPTEFEDNLARLTSQLANSQSVKEAVVVDILVVDDSAMYRVEVQGMHSRVSRVSAGNHRPASLRIVTTVPVVNSIGSFEARIAGAMQKGLLEIETIRSTKSSDAAGD